MLRPIQVLVEDETLQALLQDPPPKVTVSTSDTKTSPSDIPAANPDTKMVKKRPQSSEGEGVPVKRQAVSPKSTPVSTPCKNGVVETVTPEKSPRDKFGGHTSRADHCWICKAPRLKDQKGSACSYCVAEARKELGHQRLNQLLGNEELISNIAGISLEKRAHDAKEKSRKVNPDEVSLNRLIARLESTVDRVQGLEVLVKDLAQIVSQMKR